MTLPKGRVANVNIDAETSAGMENRLVKNK